MAYRQLTQEQRYQIWACLKMKMKRSEIARMIGVHRSTITRELRRNASGRWKYNPSRAIWMTRDRHKQKRKYRLGEATWELVGRLLELGWSPEQISHRIVLESGGARVSRETIYQYVYRDKREGGQLHRHLRRRHTYRRRINKYHCRKGWGTRRSIHDRPVVLDARSRIGDWERTRSSAGSSGAGSCHWSSEGRVHCVLSKVATKSSPHGRGQPFARRCCRSRAACSPSRATNGTSSPATRRSQSARRRFLLRRPVFVMAARDERNTTGSCAVLPKATDFADVTVEAIRDVADRLNNRPRKALLFPNTSEVFNNRFVALILN